MSEDRLNALIYPLFPSPILLSTLSRLRLPPFPHLPPPPPQDGKKMDKAGILRATIAFLKMKNESTQRDRAFEIDLSWKPSFLSNNEFSQMMMESIDGFCIMFQVVSRALDVRVGLVKKIVTFEFCLKTQDS